MKPLAPLEFSNVASARRYDAVVVGSGPNGLAAAIRLAQAGRSVLVVEAQASIGGGTRTTELTLPGFLHDVCSAVHAVGRISPWLESLSLAGYGLEWITPPVAAAHPLDDGRAASIEQSLDATVAGLGPDGDAYRWLFEPLLQRADRLLPDLLGTMRLPSHPLAMLRFGRQGIRSAEKLATQCWQGEAAQAAFAGMAAHSVLPLERPLTAGVGLVLMLTAHLGGWPVARGGSQQIADAMARCLLDHGGEIVVNHPITSLEQLPDAQAVLFDVTPGQLTQIAGDALPASFQRRLNAFRFGPGVFKIDWALDGPIPWQAQACRQAGTVHVGGALAEVAASERAVWQGTHPERPFVLVAQQSLFDSTRSPSGKHTGWGYCHVPSGSTVDMTEAIEQQIERFAPGFRDLVLERAVTSPAGFEAYNANYVGGDITGGVMDLRQMAARPSMRWSPYTTPNPRLFLCSASTPPGGGVHGMCGYHAANAALVRVLR